MSIAKHRNAIIRNHLLTSFVIVAKQFLRFINFYKLILKTKSNKQRLAFKYNGGLIAFFYLIYKTMGIIKYVYIYFHQNILAVK